MLGVLKIVHYYYGQLIPFVCASVVIVSLASGPLSLQPFSLQTNGTLLRYLLYISILCRDITEPHIFGYYTKLIFIWTKVANTGFYYQTIQNRANAL